MAAYLFPAMAPRQTAMARRRVNAIDRRGRRSDMETRRHGKALVVSRAFVIASTAEAMRAHHDGEALLALYHRTGDRRVRDRAIEHYTPLARRLAARYRHREPFEDLVQVACLGLVNAVERFDPTRGKRFTSFAVPTISGELRRYFRSTAWNLHVPRGMQENALATRNAAHRLTDRLGRAPRIGELAQETGLDTEAISEALYAYAVQTTSSLDRPVGAEGDTTLADLVGAWDDGFELAERYADLGPLLRSLPARERTVLFLRFARDMTQTEIAQQVGCSQMQVSRILRRVVAQLADAATSGDGRSDGARSAEQRSSALVR
jgi:RNA polymerase sigma-B factor